MRDYVRLIVLMFIFFGVALAIEAAIRAVWSVPSDSSAPLVLAMLGAYLPVEVWLRRKGLRKKQRPPFDLTWGDLHPFAAAGFLAGGLFIFVIVLALIRGWLFWAGFAWAAAMAGAAFVLLSVINLAARWLRRGQARKRGLEPDHHRYELNRRVRRVLIALAGLVYAFLLLGFIADLIADIHG